MSEPELRAQLHATPGDEQIWHVYADWLEAHGKAREALVAQAVARLNAVDSSPEAFLIAREVLGLAAGLPRAWLDELAPPAERIVGTTWGGRDASGQVYLVRFVDDATIYFHQGRPEAPHRPLGSGHGAWMQIGRAVTFSVFESDTTEDFTRHDGVLATRDRLLGIASDAAINGWSWELGRLADAHDDLSALPADGTPVRISTSACLPRRRW